VTDPPLDRDAVVERLGAAEEVELLRDRLSRWLEKVDPELQDPLRWAFAGTPKHFRPLTLFACARSAPVTSTITERVELAFVVELVHNMSLIIDDVLDGSTTRRGVTTVNRQFGQLPALMASGYLVADAFAAVADDPFAVAHLADLLRRLGAAECLQWRLRRQPLGVEDWRRIAGEDTGSMFEICAVLGARSERLRRYGHLLGVLYHGCDDVGDQRGLDALGGGGEDDIRDGILTLPAALAIRDARIRRLFTTDDDDPRRLATLTAACRAQLDEAETVLDRIADAADAEADQFAVDPAPLHELVASVRQLSLH
jgi:geranylgeranyl pyrophosphate synthase